MTAIKMKVFRTYEGDHNPHPTNYTFTVRNHSPQISVPENPYLGTRTQKNIVWKFQTTVPGTIRTWKPVPVKSTIRTCEPVPVNPLSVPVNPYLWTHYPYLWNHSLGSIIRTWNHSLEIPDYPKLSSYRYPDIRSQNFVQRSRFV